MAYDYTAALAALQRDTLDPLLSDRERILALNAEDALTTYVQERISNVRRKSDPLGHQAVKPAPKPPEPEDE